MRVYYLQLNALKTDQRAWVQLTVDNQKLKRKDGGGLDMSPGTPYSVPILFKNIGKTAAKNVDVHYFLFVVEREKGPDLDMINGEPQNEDKTSVLFPNEAHEVPARFRQLTSDGHWVQGAISSEIVDDFNAGRAYLSVFGIVYYDDIFGAHHWTKFCYYWFPPVGGSFNAVDCATFGDVDKN